jgi:hypothetical protein
LKHHFWSVINDLTMAKATLLEAKFEAFIIYDNNLIIEQSTDYSKLAASIIFQNNIFVTVKTS